MKYKAIDEERRHVLMPIQVAAAIIRQEDKILICQRGEGGSCAYLWEFPGGKLETDETLEECVIRECCEELHVLIAVKRAYTKTVYWYPEREVEITFFDAELIGGVPQAEVHVAIQWVHPQELKDYAFCPADGQVVDSLIEQ